MSFRQVIALIALGRPEQRRSDDHGFAKLSRIRDNPPGLPVRKYGMKHFSPRAAAVPGGGGL